MKEYIILPKIMYFATLMALVPLGFLFGFIDSWNAIDINMQSLMLFFAVWPIILVLFLKYGHNINLSKYKEVK